MASCAPMRYWKAARPLKKTIWPSSNTSYGHPPTSSPRSASFAPGSSIPSTARRPNSQTRPHRCMTRPWRRTVRAATPSRRWSSSPRASTSSKLFTPAWFSSRSKPPPRVAPRARSRSLSLRFRRCAKKSGRSSSAQCEGISMTTTGKIEDDNIVTGAIVDGTQALQHDAYDVQEFDRAIGTYQRLAAAVSSAGEELNTASALIRDLFWSFHKRAPRINENLALKPAFAVNRRILEEIMSTAEWRQLREAGSINDPMISAIATIGACERAIDALDHGSRNRINRLASANEAAEKLFGQADVLDELASQATAQQVEDLRKRAARSRAAADARNEPPRRLKNHSTWTMTNGTGQYGWRRGGGWQKPLKRPKRFRTRSRLSAEVIPQVTEEAERRL